MIYTVTFNPAIDYVMHPLTLDMGFTNRSSSEELYCGGNGINIAYILNELDVDNVALGFIGGFTGDYMLKTLQQQGITTSFITLDEGFTRINVKMNGVVMTMCNGMGPKIPIEKVNELFHRLDRIDKGDVLVLTGSIPSCLPDDMYDIIMTRLAGRGIKFVVDAAGDLLLQSLAAKPFLIKPNNHELGRIFDVHPETPEDCLPYARKLHDQGAQNVIVSCGKWGSALIDEDGKEHIVPVPKCRLVNATGAGDSMVGGFLAKATQGADYETALRFASACGSATAASSGIAKRSTIDKFSVSLNKRMKEEAAAKAADQKAPAKKPAAKTKAEDAAD
ncbi:MAG: 1-phosphofructokinase [Atopobiaceae bacterium]|nr:1-phosphofructokinase [Atopobiaceae bacterium]MCH4181181.1 1-phosphofructokinase [Atopobiaceae bacterium]MCH4214946.1 1-phosphofructokinase [Atopobiaceae bacterium]MCH4277097.1 1-phosphofructokinase [Atopobiaceae bacterium]MCI1227351.1 1-phosphofructokinase [Atopobiaceae bacterium]